MPDALARIVGKTDSLYVTDVVTWDVTIYSFAIGDMNITWSTGQMSIDQCRLKINIL